MKNSLGFLLIALLTILSACKKDDPVPSPVPVTTIKYELNFTSALKDTSANAVIKYTDGNGTLQTVTDFLPGTTSWTKTVTVNSTTRPFPIEFKSVGTANNYFYLTAPGTVSARIFVDNGIRAYNTSTTVNGPGYYRNSFALNDTLR